MSLTRVPLRDKGGGRVSRKRSGEKANGSLSLRISLPPQSGALGSRPTAAPRQRLRLEARRRLPGAVRPRQIPPADRDQVRRHLDNARLPAELNLPSSLNARGDGATRDLSSSRFELEVGREVETLEVSRFNYTVLPIYMDTKYIPNDLRASPNGHELRSSPRPRPAVPSAWTFQGPHPLIVVRYSGGDYEGRSQSIYTSSH